MRIGFSKKLIACLVCQSDNARLEIGGMESGNDEAIFNGFLKCVRCGKAYQIKNGILFILPEQTVNDEKIGSEIAVRDAQAGGYDARLSARHDREIPSTLAQVGDVSGKKIIEYGCGTGRFTEEFVDYSCLLGVDISFNSLEILSCKLKSNNVGLVWADVTSFKTAKGFFDIAFSAQVLEHLPSDAYRNQFLQNINFTLAPGKPLILSAYHLDLRRRLKKLPKEGVHPSGIYYYYFSAKDIINLFNKNFFIDNVSFIDIALPFEQRMGFLKKIYPTLFRLAEHLPIIRGFSHLILIKAHKPVISSRICYGLFDTNFLKKCWRWFEDPQDIPGVGMINFFSYHNIDKPDFHKRAGLTTVIDLRQSIETIWSKMRKNYICKQIQRGERNGIIVKNDLNHKEFRRIYSIFRSEKGLPIERVNHYLENGLLFSAYYKNEMIAGGIFISDTRNIRAWALSSLRFSDSQQCEIVGQANRMIVWEAIRYAKLTDHEIFDLGGISPDSNQRGLRSIAEFKEAFGGERKQCYYYYKVYSSVIKYWMRIRGFKNV
ncbi:MAG: class I SAM-dependent methyltransferase [Patescibacteria group bacterium]|nr:class I SAM-dependent methyltransferase [Patescibacteria group bacterium]